MIERKVTISADIDKKVRLYYTRDDGKLGGSGGGCLQIGTSAASVFIDGDDAIRAFLALVPKLMELAK